MCHVGHVVGAAGPEREVKVPECALKEAVSRHHVNLISRKMGQNWVQAWTERAGGPVREEAVC